MADLLITKNILVNDLTSGGSKKGLSAEQGKFIKDSFSASLFGTGWQKNLSGKIEQWGTTILAPVGNFNAQVINGVTYYTHYYTVNYPIAFPSNVFSTDVSIACANGTDQTGMFGITVSANLNGFEQPLTRLTIAVTTTVLGYIPVVHWKTIGS